MSFIWIKNQKRRDKLNGVYNTARNTKHLISLKEGTPSSPKTRRKGVRTG